MVISNKSRPKSANGIWSFPLHVCSTGFFCAFSKKLKEKKTQGIFTETQPIGGILPKNQAKISILFLFVAQNFFVSHKFGKIF